MTLVIVLQVFREIYCQYELVSTRVHASQH